MTQINAPSKTDQKIQLSDGRTLGFAEYGSTEGDALFYCHGYPGSRFEAGVLDGIGRETGTRIISPDRPGMGLSTFQPGRTFLDWPDDVAELADHLQIDRFAVVGISGGGPYALACACKMPDRLVSCGVVSGMGPLELGTAGMSRSNRLIFFCARRLPWLLTPLFKAMARSLGNEEKTRKTMAKTMQHMVRPDREALQAFGVEDMFAATAAESFRQGARGAAYEGRLYGRPWDFRLEELDFQPLYLWHGELDQNVPVGMARGMASRVAHCQATFYPDEGHISAPLNHQRDILSALLPR